MATENAAPAATQTIEVSRQQGGEIDPLAIIERRNQMLERLLDYAIKATHAGQWTDQQGKPFPTAAAAEVKARRCAVRISNVRKQKIESQDDLGAFYMYLVEATASLPGEWDSLEAMGTCSSRDQFIGTNGTKHQLSDIDEGNILKAAYSNLIVNAVTRLLGVRNLTWEALGKLGISQQGASKVEYDSGAKGGGRGKLDDEKPIPFGRAKGKKVSEAADEELSWLLGKMKEPASDPKFQSSNDRWVKAIEAEQARRSNAASGTTAASAAPGGAALWQRIRALDKEIPEGELRELVKTTTKKVNAKDLVEADVALMAEALRKRAADRNEDIPF
jgi:hypothetical protein